MARRRFFVEEIRRDKAELTGTDAEHLVRVLRVEPGQIFELSDNQDVYLAEVESARKSEVVFHIREKLSPPEPEAELVLLPALFKFDRFEWLIEKSTELNVTIIQPWDAIRTEHGLAQASRKRIGRWKKIGQEASQQSRRAHLPRIEPVIPLKKALETEARVRLLLDEDRTALPLATALPQERGTTDRIAVLLGPEGGWTQAERDMAVERGWTSCSLGPTVLRSETAAIAALAIVRAAWQRSTPASPHFEGTPDMVHVTHEI